MDHQFTHLKPKSESELAMASLYQRLKDDDSEINPLTLSRAIRRMLSDYYDNSGVVNYSVSDNKHTIKIAETISLSEWDENTSEEADKRILFKLKAVLSPEKHLWEYEFDAEDEETGKYQGHDAGVVQMAESVFLDEEGQEFEYYFLDEIYDDEFGKFKSEIFGNRERLEDEPYDEEKFYPELEEAFTHLRPKTSEEIKQAKDSVKIEIDRLTNRLNRLRNYHPEDDNPFGSGMVRNQRMELRNQLAKLRQSILTDEQKNKQTERENRAIDKRIAKADKVFHEKMKQLRTLTPKQKAINKIIDMQYQLRLVNARIPRLQRLQYQGVYIQTSYEQSVEIKKEINKLKAEFNIKSYDLRRQKKYNPDYE